MMRVGRAFTHNGRRYEPGDLIDLRALPAHLHGTFIRLYGLTPYLRRRTKAEEQTT